MLKSNGLFIFTCASTGRKEHGTIRTSINDSYGTIAQLVDMQDYYKNLTENDLNEVLNLKTLFSKYDTYCDLYFVGIKKKFSLNSITINDLPTFTDENNIIKTTDNIS